MNDFLTIPLDNTKAAAVQISDRLNEVMMSLPNHRVQSNGTRISIQPAGEHFYDAGLDCVSEFHKTFGITQPAAPTIPEMSNSARLEEYATTSAKLATSLKTAAAVANAAGDTGAGALLVRLQLIQEELSELAEGMLHNSIVECLDALGDLSYVVDGTYLTLGLGSYKLAAIAEIHSSNMSKLDEEGSPIIAASGRVVKGPNYRRPDLETVLGDY